MSIEDSKLLRRGRAREREGKEFSATVSSLLRLLLKGTEHNYFCHFWSKYTF